MTVASTSARFQYTGNGATTSFAFANVFVNADDVVVDLRNSLGVAQPSVRNGAGPYDYTLSAMPDPETGEYLSGSNILFNQAPPAGYVVTLFRDPPATQSLDLQSSGKLPVARIETEFDQLALGLQAVLDRAGRSLMAPVNDPVPPPLMTLPTIADRAGAIMGFDAAGRPAVGGNLDILINLLAGAWTPSLTNIAWCPSITGLRGLAAPLTTAFVMLTGYYNAGDKNPVLYRFTPANTASDDGGFVIKPNSISSGNPGRWLLITGRRLNVLDWGADPTGGLDSAPAVRAAAAMLVANGGGELHFPAGELYAFNSVIPSGIVAFDDTGVKIANVSHFKISCKGARIMMSAAADYSTMFIFSHCDDFTVEGLRVTGRRDGLTTQETGAFGLYNCSNFLFTDLRHDGNWGGQSGSGVIAYGNWLVNGSFRDIIAEKIGMGFDLGQVMNLEFDRITLKGADNNGNQGTGQLGDRGFSFLHDNLFVGLNETGYSFTEANQVRLRDCKVSNFSTGMHIGVGTDYTIDGCDFSDQPGLGAVEGIAIAILYYGTGQYQTTGAPQKRIKILNSDFRNNGSVAAGAAISIDDTQVVNSDLIEDILIEGNIFTNNASYAIWYNRIGTPGQLRRLTIQNNEVRGSYPLVDAGLAQGDYLGGPVPNVLITGNLGFNPVGASAQRGLPGGTGNANAFYNVFPHPIQIDIPPSTAAYTVHVIDLAGTDLNLGLVAIGAHWSRVLQPNEGIYFSTALPSATWFIRGL